MPSPEETPAKYDAVLIVGPAISARYIGAIIRQASSVGKSLCVIGDGRSGVPKAAIARSIEGRVDDNTLFILDGHGIALFGRHWISLSSSPVLLSSTLSIIDTLIEATNREGVRSPTVCVFSCCAGGVGSHIQRRKKGIDATVVAHGPADDSTFDNFSYASIVRYIANGRVPFLDDQGHIVHEELIKEPDAITIIRPNERVPVVYYPIENVIARKRRQESIKERSLDGMPAYSLENMAYLCALRGKREELQEVLEIDGLDHAVVLSEVMSCSHLFSNKPLNTLLAAGVNLCENKSALRQAAVSNNRSAVKALLEAGVDPTGLDILENDVEPEMRALVERAQVQWELDRPERFLSEIEAIAAGSRDGIKISSL